MENVVNALQAWRELLGPEYVLTDEGVLAVAQTATFSTTQQIPAVIRPASRGEVQQCMKIANTYRTPVYPVSTGKNWGYGSRVPAANGCVLMELSRLNSIVDYNEKLAYVTVEPGVTFRQLIEFLQARKSPLRLSLTGGSWDASLIGNAVERGLGSGPYGDRFAYVSDLEVVLPTGDCIHTGWGRFPKAHAREVHRWGVGPSLDGLFSQSNLGIVTRMTIWLVPAPKYTQTCIFAIQDASRLEDVVDRLQTLTFDGLFNSPIRLLNDYKLLTSAGQKRGQDDRAGTFLSPRLMHHMRTIFGLGAWNGMAELHAPSEKYGQVVRELIQQALEQSVDQLVFLDQHGTWTPAKINQGLLAMLGFVNDSSTSGMMGSDGSLRSMYWRKKTPIPTDIDPDRDRCGVLWCAPCVPFDGAHVRSAVEIIEQTFMAHRFEPNLALNCMTGRAVVITAGLVYDREEPGADAHAHACYEDVFERLVKAGYLPYRLGIQSMNTLPTPGDDYGVFMKTLKTSLDPNVILAPGRYDFQTDW